MKPVRRRSDDLSPKASGHIGDLRFRSLLSSDDWNGLPLAVQSRFSKRLAGGETVTYVGEVLEASFSRLGWYFAQAARFVGGPLPTSSDIHVPSVVTVTEDMSTGGQIWTRMYARRDGFPQVIHSSKRFSGSTGLEEYVGCGLKMALNVLVENQSLLFKSAGYFLLIGSLLSIRLPSWMTPGDLTVRHTDLGSGEFLFSLDIHHRRFGLLIRQVAVFREAAP